MFSSSFWNVSEQPVQLFRQINFCTLLQDNSTFSQYLLFTFRQVFTFPCTNVESVILNFKLDSTSNIPEGYSEPNQKPKMELFAKIVNGV